MNYLDNIPKVLYKYRVWNNTLHQRLLTENEIFLASPANLNDPFDASLPFQYDPSLMTKENITRKLLEQGRLIWPDISDEELHDRAFKEQSSGKFEDGSYWKDQHEKTKADLHKTIGLLSLTTHPDNLLMWAHYANCHSGFCVGLDSNILFEVIGGTIGPVTYVEDFPLMSLFPEDGESVKHMVKMLNSKSPHWTYENEYRLTKSESANKAYELPSEAIKEVVLGCKMRQDDMTAIIEVMDSKFPNARIFEAKTSLESFTLNLHEAVSIK
ncbi:hypothetical protein D3C87_850620 [compost metagenome]